MSMSPYRFTYPDGIDWDASVYVSLHTGPVAPPDDTTVVSGAWYTRHGDITWTQAPVTITHYAFGFEFGVEIDDDDPYELDMTDATPTGVGDPLADVLRSIDDLLEGQ